MKKYSVLGLQLDQFDIDRLYTKFQICEDGCWRWTAGLNVPAPLGYGRFWMGKVGLLAHRVVYEWLRGRIPDGMELDHLCRNRQCVNPDHLEPVSREENLRRGKPNAAKLYAARTHCKHGHLLAGDNLKPNSKGFRLCRKCCQRRSLEWWYKKKQSTMHAMKGGSN